MKIVMKADFEGTLNAKLFILKAKDIVEVSEGDCVYLTECNALYDIIEDDDVLTVDELEDVIQTEVDAIDAEIERAIVEDEQTEIEALEAETEISELEDERKPKSKRRKK